jgi:hypothetical protein
MDVFFSQYKFFSISGHSQKITPNKECNKNCHQRGQHSTIFASTQWPLPYNTNVSVDEINRCGELCIVHQCDESVANCRICLLRHKWTKTCVHYARHISILVELALKSISNWQFITASQNIKIIPIGIFFCQIDIVPILHHGDLCLSHRSFLFSIGNKIPLYKWINILLAKFQPSLSLFYAKIKKLMQRNRTTLL